MTALVAVIAFPLVISEGEDEQAQPSIAGGYDNVSGHACLGPKFDVKQSGTFVNLDNTKGTLGGKLEFDEGELTGDVDCVEGGKQEIEARAADEVIEGTLGGEPVKADLKREVPPAGTPKPRPPDSLEGEEYRISPRSTCLGVEDRHRRATARTRSSRRANRSASSSTTTARSPARSPALTASGRSTARRSTARST